MVYLEEAHRQGEHIAELINRDLSACPDMVLVLGTSLKLSGPWEFVRQFARRVGANGGKVAYVNLAKPSQRGYSLFDYWAEWECDSRVQDLKSRLEFFHSAVTGSLPRRPLAYTLGGRVSRRPMRRLGKKAKDEP
ncbi:NAD-dependent histone deacetylase HST4, partial [Madurella mycetomatis]